MHLAYQKNLILKLIGNVRNKHAWKNVRPSSSDRGKAKCENSLIMQKENKLTKDRMVWSNSQVKEGRRETGLY